MKNLCSGFSSQLHNTVDSDNIYGRPLGSHFGVLFIFTSWQSRKVSGRLPEKWQLSVYQRKNKEKVSEKSDLIIPPQGSTFMLKNPKITVE